MIIGTILQQPAEMLDYDIDYTGFFSSIEYESDDVIAQGNVCSVVVTPDEGVVATVVRSSDKVLKVVISEVVAGSEFKVTVTMVTQSGRIKEDELILVGIDF